MSQILWRGPADVLPFPAPKPPRRRGPPLVRVSMGLVNRAMMAFDGMVFVGAAMAYHGIRIAGGSPLSEGQTLILALATGGVFVGAVTAVSGYRVERYRRPLAMAADLALGLACATAAGGVLLWAYFPEALSAQAAIIGWSLTSLVLLLPGRMAAASVVNAFARNGLFRRRAALVGAGALAEEAAARLSADRERYQLAGRFSDSDASLSALHRLAQASPIDLIVLALPFDQVARIRAAAEAVRWVSADLMMVLPSGDIFSNSRVLTEIGGLPALQLADYPLKGSQGLLKAALDGAVALAAAVALAPLMILAAVLVRLSGPGPILFRQRRLGFNGRPFEIIKFRTMTVDEADDGSAVQAADNPRITAIGAFLRRTSLDELPQLINVLRGEMSIVGPRPHVPNMQVGAGAYAEAVRAYAARHQIRPGITGWAQVNGMRGGIDSLEKARAGVELDLYYIRNWSLTLDLKIMVLTLGRLVGRDVF